MLHQLIEIIVPAISAICELMGIVIIVIAAGGAFFYYFKDMVSHKKVHNIKFDLAEGLATALEFKMAAEILKTVTVRTLDELLILPIPPMKMPLAVPLSNCNKN